MAMTWLWLAMIGLSVVFGIQNGTLEAVSAAAGQGAQSAVELCFSMAGTLCLWSGIMEVLRACGALEKLSLFLRPVLGALFPAFRRDQAVMEALSANVSANLLGLGNAATPMGIQASKGMAKRSPGVASDELCLFVVCNTASIQLIPTTVAAVRAGAGCQTPFDILPAVWLASICSVTVGILAAKVLCRMWRDG